MRRAFTLIELLVVIAIISILAAILFPVFARAKEAARQIQTLSNTKQLALGMAMYMSDNDDRYPVGITVWWDDEDSRWRSKWPWFQRMDQYLTSNEIREAHGHPKDLPRRRGKVARWGTHIAINPSLGWGNKAIQASVVENPAGLVSLHLAANYRPELLESDDNLDPTKWKKHAYWYLGWGAYGTMLFRGNTHYRMYDPARRNPALTRPVMVYRENALAAFCDGHVKTMAISKLVGPMPLGLDVGAEGNYWDNR